MGAALAKQIPALIKRFLKVTKPLSGVADLARVVLHLAAQLMLGIDHLADAREDVGVIHRDSLREARFVGISDHPGLMIMVRSTSRFRTWARTSFGHDGDYRGPRLTAEENDGFSRADAVGLIACPTGCGSAVTGSSAETRS
jgi:hypothetical protein